MNRLTQKRVNGIKTGYWSASKKDDLAARLAEYEDTGLEPEEVLQLKKESAKHQWIFIEERLPEPEKRQLLSFDNLDLPMIGRYTEDADGDGVLAQIKDKEQRFQERVQAAGLSNETVTMAQNRDLRKVIHDITGGSFLTQTEWLAIIKIINAACDRSIEKEMVGANV